MKNTMKYTIGVVLLAIAATACSSTKPLDALSRSEGRYWTQLETHLADREAAFEEAVRNRLNMDFLHAEARYRRMKAKDQALIRYHQLVKQGVVVEEAARIAGVERLDAEQEILDDLEAVTRRREQEIRSLQELYAKMRQAVAALAQNQKKITEYLELSGFWRMVSDVKGLDRDQLKLLGDELKGLRGIVEKEVRDR